MTQALGYKYDIFSEKAEVTSSISPTVAPTLNRIFGGRQVEVGEVPWQVNLLNHTTSTWVPRVRIGYHYYSLLCGGAIVSNSKIISAAHCMMKSDSSLESVETLKIIAGHSSITSAKQIADIEKFAIHP